MTNQEIIERATQYLNHHLSNGHLFGDVAATLITDDDLVFSGVCLDTGSGTGFCAETNAIGAMVTSKRYKIKKIVAVWKDEQGSQLTVLPPCGRCREFMRQIDTDNLTTEVVLGYDESVQLRELLPHNEWPEPLPLSS